MTYKKMIAYVDAQNERTESLLQLADDYDNNGADGLIIYDYSKDEISKERLLSAARKVSKNTDLPIILGLYVNRFEDVKKALYTGADKVMVKYSLIQDKKEEIKEAVKRFGTDKLILEVDSANLLTPSFAEEYKGIGFCSLLLKHLDITERLKSKIGNLPLPVIARDSLSKNSLYDLITLNNVTAVATNHFECRAEIEGVERKSIVKAKAALKKQGVAVQIFESSMDFSKFRLDSSGLLPVVVQDYQTYEVLMVAYMNQEAFEHTFETGRMTYFSRSRNELWIKGLTSGHYQYVKSLSADCDNDTLLAKVKQVGAACHTGNRSCFYKELVSRKYNQTNPLTVLQDIYQTILDRKQHPKEGSYTNYLFDKGIDKILKKCGEEATEIVIAAKNPDTEELKYEISDFLYHMMVLMAEREIDWGDILKELSHRR